jgi:hypothetical protein
MTEKLGLTTSPIRSDTLQFRTAITLTVIRKLLHGTLSNTTHLHYTESCRLFVTGMRFEVLTAVEVSMFVFCVATPYGLVGRDQYFEKPTVSIFRAEANKLCLTLSQDVIT